MKLRRNLKSENEMKYNSYTENWQHDWQEELVWKGLNNIVVQWLYNKSS